MWDKVVAYKYVKLLSSARELDMLQESPLLDISLKEKKKQKRSIHR